MGSDCAVVLARRTVQERLVARRRMISSQIARFFDSGATLQSVISFKVR
jgi:hypothetical protein